MNATNMISKKYSILVVYTDDASRENIEDLMSLSSNYTLNLLELDNADNYKPDTPPELIFVDLHEFSESKLKLLMTLRQQFKNLPLILLSGEVTDQQMRQLLKLRLDDWHKKPLDRKLFHSSIMANLQDSRASASKVHAIISAIGGVGATSIAISAADLLLKRIKKSKLRVTLFDMDFSTGNCGYSLNSLSNYNLETVLNNPARMDAEFIDIIKMEHESGISMFSFKRPEIITSPNGSELVLRMLDAVSMQYDHTILDIPYYEVPWKDEVLNAVNTVTIVSNLTLPAIKHAKELLQRIETIRNDQDGINLVFNKTQRSLFGRSIHTKSLKELFDGAKLINFADDSSTMVEAVNRGVLPSEVNARSRFLKDLGKYVDQNFVKDRVTA